MNSSFGSPLISLIILDIVIVIFLYSVTYVGYLATLYHPRNLQTIPVWKRILIALSLILNAAFCSVSAMGLDFPTLIASSIFLLFLFLILGAASFAWNFGASIRWEVSSQIFRSTCTGTVACGDHHRLLDRQPKTKYLVWYRHAYWTAMVAAFAQRKSVSSTTAAE